MREVCPSWHKNKNSGGEGKGIIEITHNVSPEVIWKAEVKVQNLRSGHIDDAKNRLLRHDISITM